MSGIRKLKTEVNLNLNDTEIKNMSKVYLKKVIHGKIENLAIEHLKTKGNISMVKENFDSCYSETTQNERIQILFV